MLFIGFCFLFGKTPEKPIFDNYVRSRRIMGGALLILSANYSVHFFLEPRFMNVNAAILMNLSTYFLCYWLFSSALTTLLDRFYITRRRLWTHLGLWALFSVLSGAILLLLPDGTMQKVGLAAMAVWLLFYGLFFARRLILAYRRAVRIFNDTQSDDIGDTSSGCPYSHTGLSYSASAADCSHSFRTAGSSYGFSPPSLSTYIFSILTRTICCFTNR